MLKWEELERASYLNDIQELDRHKCLIRYTAYDTIEDDYVEILVCNDMVISHIILELDVHVRNWEYYKRIVDAMWYDIEEL